MTNLEFDQAYADPYNRKVMKKLQNKYASFIGEVEAEQCALEGLWKALRNYDKSRGTKFVTVLYTYICNECKTAKTKLSIAAHHKKLLASHGGPDDEPSPVIESIVREEDLERVTGLMERLDPEDRFIVKSKFFGGKSFTKIGRELGVSHETVRYRFRRAINWLKLVCIK